MGKIAALVLFVTATTFAWADGETSAKLIRARVGKADLRLEIAESYEERARGLMFRSSLPADAGMIFLFETEQPLTFWMKNTMIPLSIAFLDRNMKIIDIQDMAPESGAARELARYPSAKPAQYALEVNQGWFRRNKITLGDKLTFSEQPPQPQLRRFFRSPGPKSKAH